MGLSNHEKDERNIDILLEGARWCISKLERIFRSGGSPYSIGESDIM